MCDTNEGSSGAPVVKTQSKHRYVIALHRGWYKLNGNNYNYGTLMSTIVNHIHGTDPSYCECHVTIFLPSIICLYYVVGDDNDIVKEIENAGIPM